MGETLNFNLHVYERDDIARLPFNLLVTTAGNDTLPFALDLTEHDFFADPCRYVGAEVDFDRGDGAMVPLTDSEMPTTITLHGSLDGFGIRELTFGRIGPGQSPINSGSLRGAQRVKMSAIRGTLGGFRAWPMFEGYLRDARCDTFPPASAIVAQDGSVLNEPLFYTLAARTNTSRLDVITDICERNGIRVGTFAFTDTDNVGGYVVKEINEAGNRSVLAFLAEFVSPTGCRIYWRDGALNIKRFSTDDASIRTLNFSDLRKPVTVTPVPANTPNVVRLASEIYEYTGPMLDGVQPPITTDVVNAVYQPIVATHKQESTTGVISALALSSDNIMREVSKVVTTNTYTAGTLTGWTIETYGWYNPKACNLKQDGSGVTRYNEDFDVYKTPDLTWHYQQEETYQVIEKRVVVAVYDSDSILSYETETYYAFYDRWAPIGQRNGTNTATVYVADVYLKDDGTGWLYGRERIDAAALELPLTLTRWTSYSATTRGLIATTTAVAYPSVSVPYGTKRWHYQTSTSAANLYVFGPTAAPIYGTLYIYSSFAVDNWTTTYTAMTETTHSRVVTKNGNVFPPEGGGPFIQYTSLPAPMVAEDVTVNEPLPKIEMLVSAQVPEPASVTSIDRVGVALLGKRNTANMENGWCENTDEMDAAAFDVLRFSRAIPVSIEMDLDFDIVEGSVITLPPHPDLGQSEVKVLCMDCSWTLDQTAPGMGQLTVDALFFPPELTE